MELLPPTNFELLNNSWDSIENSNSLEGSHALLSRCSGVGSAMRSMWCSAFQAPSFKIIMGEKQLNTLPVHKALPQSAAMVFLRKSGLILLHHSRALFYALEAVHGIKDQTMTGD